MTNDEDRQYDVVLRDPGSILLERLRCDEVYGCGEPTIREFECSDLVKSGDNYGSTILRVRAVIGRAGGGDDGAAEDEEEVLELVAKMLPASEMARRIFDVQFTFKKEVFLYEDLIPTYRSLWDGGDFEVAPKFYGSRLSLTGESGDEVDSDAVILMENLKANGYYMADRHRGLDEAHLRIALSTLAKFHAVGLAVKHKLPAYLDELEKYAKPLPLQGDITKPFIESALAEVGRDARVSPYLARVIASGHIDDLEATYHDVLDAREPWACVVHDDFWINNMMFRRDGEGRPREARIVDFQTYCMSSPLGDLVFFLCTSMRFDDEDAATTTARRFDELLEYYRRRTSGYLTEQLGCAEAAEALFEGPSFEERLRIDARRELFHLVTMTKVVELREGESLLDSPGNEHYLERFARIVEIYMGKDWI